MAPVKDHAMQQISLVIMGAAGRMGSTLIRLAKTDPAFRLAALMERPELTGQLLQAEGCLTGSDLDQILPQVKGAVIIDFTSPEGSLATAAAAVRHGNTQVIGTTGFTPTQKAELEALAAQTPIFWAPNMSVGVNVLLKILPLAARLLGDQYDMELLEIHHNKKKDAPSGTALRLAETMAEARGWDLPGVACYHREGITGERPQKQLGMQTLRGGDVTGIHTAYFFGPGERIEITHQAHSRDNFAQGALQAAKWLSVQKAGQLWGMQDMLP